MVSICASSSRSRRPKCFHLGTIWKRNTSVSSSRQTFGPWIYDRNPSCTSLIKGASPSRQTSYCKIKFAKPNFYSTRIMKLSFVLAPLALISSLVSALSVSYDTAYDNAGQSLDTVACSNGPNGLETRGFTTFGSLPTFPRIGGAPSILAWDSPNCGGCWNLTYVNPQGKSNSIVITAIDVATPNYNIGLKAMNQLTNNQAVALGRVTITAAALPASSCGL